MQNYSFLLRLATGLLCLCLGGSQLGVVPSQGTQMSFLSDSTTCQNRPTPNFLVVAGGGSRESNEIALEKNLLYFQRTLRTFGYNPAEAIVFFANGNDGGATIRYIDRLGQQHFKSPEIPHLRGGATGENLDRWFGEMASTASRRPLFFYFTGHGLPQSLILWGHESFTVADLSRQLDRLPRETPVVLMMAQCYSGSFADFIYQGGDRARPLSPQTRCGFFATVASRPSVGCTPLIDEADYRDYSSSFFAGLSGVTRTGQSVPSADYNGDGRVSYAEAHGFAKVDEKTMDWPISTSEAWLQNRATQADRDRIFGRAIATLLSTARPEQEYVVNSIVSQFNFDRQASLAENLSTLPDSEVGDRVQAAYLMRLQMELVNIGMEAKLRAAGDAGAIATLDRLLNCESGSWQ